MSIDDNRLVIFKDEVLTVGGDNGALARLHTDVLAKYVHELALARRIPELFRKRRWPCIDSLMDVAMGAICYMKAGMFGEVLEIPDEALHRPEWADLVDQGCAPCTSIVADLDLGDLLEP